MPQVLLGRVDEAEEVATEVLDGLGQLGASTEERETCVFSDLIALRALERALEEEVRALILCLPFCLQLRHTVTAPVRNRGCCGQFEQWR